MAFEWRNGDRAGELSHGPFAKEAKAAVNTGHIRIGIGGWSYPPWRGTFYPPAAAAAGARICVAAVRGDRDQRDLLRPPEPGKLGGVGRGGARRLPLRGQGLAIPRHPPEAVRGRRGPRRLFRAGARRAWRQARPDPVDARGTPQVRPRGHCRFLEAPAARARRGPASPRARAAPRKLPRRASSSTSAASRTSRSCSATTTNSR